METTFRKMRNFTKNRNIIFITAKQVRPLSTVSQVRNDRQFLPIDYIGLISK